MKVIPYIPYFQTSRYRVQAMVELANVKAREKAADLGTGDGRIAIALAKAGAIVTAYELDDERIKEAEENITRDLGKFSTRPLDALEQYSSSVAKPNREVYSPVILNGSEESSFLREDSSTSPQNDDERTRMTIIPLTILKKDFWYEDLSKFSIICCYPMPDIMGRLEKKLKDELKPGSRVLLNYFPFKHWKLKKTKDNIFLYIR